MLGVLGRPLLKVSTALLLPAAAVHHHRERGDLDRFLGIRRSNPQKANRNTHQNEARFRRARGLKTLRIELKDYDEQRRRDAPGQSPVDIRTESMQRGINPYEDSAIRLWKEREISLTSLGDIIEPHVPKKLRPRLTASTAIGWREWAANLWTDGKMAPKRTYENVRSIRRIRKKVGFEHFSKETFVLEANDVFVRANEALCRRDRAALLELVTPTAFLRMWPDVERTSAMWELVEWLQPSRVISVRNVEFPSKSGNEFAQVAVRMDSLQKLAIFDRFGRLILGSEEVAQRVTEYVVFENFIASLHGRWRLVGKIQPKWAPSTKLPTLLTFPQDPDKRVEEAVDVSPSTLTAKNDDDDMDDIDKKKKKDKR